MTRSEAIRQFLRANPGSTTHQVADGLGLHFSQISPILGMFKRNGFVTSVKAGETLAGVTFNAWTMTDKKPGKRGGRGKGKRVLKAPAPQKIKANVPNLNLDSLMESMAESLVAALVGKIKDKLPKALAAISMPEMLAKSSPERPLLPAPDQPKPIAAVAPKIGVVGLLPIQAGAISAKFGESLDLRFWNDGDDKGALKGISENCEAVFLHTRHAGHHTDQLLKAYGANIRRVTGGVSNMETSVRGYFNDRI